MQNLQITEMALVLKNRQTPGNLNANFAFLVKKRNLKEKIRRRGHSPFIPNSFLK